MVYELKNKQIMLVYTPPTNALPGLGPSIFLAGSIEMGKAIKWQEDIIESLKDTECIIYNPRRLDWDPTWSQKKDNPKFNEQVCWEVKHILMADVVVFYFQPGTCHAEISTQFSPISLWELGLVSKEKKKKIIICCPEGFYRKGNLDIYSSLFNFIATENLEDFKNAIKLAVK